jgi:hypothetical protein
MSKYGRGEIGARHWTIGPFKSNMLEKLFLIWVDFETGSFNVSPDMDAASVSEGFQQGGFPRPVRADEHVQFLELEVLQRADGLEGNNLEIDCSLRNELCTLLRLPSSEE